MPEKDVRASMESVLEDLERSQRIVGLFAIPMRDVASAVVKLDGRVDRLDERVDRLDAKVDRLDAKVDRLDTKVDRLEAKVDEGFARVDESFARVDERFAKVDERFAKVDERFDHLDLQIGLVRDDVRAVIAHVESIAGYVSRDEMKDTDAG